MLALLPSLRMSIFSRVSASSQVRITLQAYASMGGALTTIICRSRSG